MGVFGAPGEVFLGSEKDIEPICSKLVPPFSDKKDGAECGKEDGDDGGGSNSWLGIDFCVI